MNTKFDHPAHLFNYKPVHLAAGLLQRVRKQGVGVIANQSNISQSALRLQQQVSLSAKIERHTQSRVDTHTVRTAQQDGQTLRVSTKQLTQGEIDNQHRQEVSQRSQQVVQGRVNGKPVYSNVEREVHQVSVGHRDADFEEARQANESTTRNVVRNGNTTGVTINIKSSGDRSRSDGVVAENRTETDARVRTYDLAGNLVSDRASRQAVTVRQEQDIALKSHGESGREIQQETTVAVHNEGNVSNRHARTATTDSSQGHQEIETHIQSRSRTLVENLGADGEVLSAKASSQQTTATETRTIDASRASHNEQMIHTLSRADHTATTSHTRYGTEATTVDRVTVDGATQQFNGDGALVREQSFDRQVTTTTTESRNGDAQSRNAITKENGATVASSDFKSDESLAYTTRVVSEQGGARAERAIESQTRTDVRGELLNRVDADGRRTISFDAQQLRDGETEDLTVNANGQGRLVETETRLAQVIQGQVEYSPDTQQVGTGLGKGAVIVDIRTAAGLRASFRFDQGTLEFDFSSDTATVSHQEITSGKVSQQDGNSTVQGAHAESQRAALESARFQGKVVASVDAQGNRVLEFDGGVTQDGAAALVVNQGQGMQAERSHTDLEVSGRLAVNRQVSSDGSKTVVQTQAEAELNVDRVENREAAAVGMPSMTRLTASDAVRAGFQAYRGALHLRAAGFEMSISFVA